MNKKLLRKKLALMLATLKKKRPFYCEVEYIQSTGTQWIDTGYYPNNNTKVEFMASGISADSFSASSTGTWFFGGRQAFQQKMYGSYYVPNTQQLTFNYGTNVNQTPVASSLVYGDKRKFYFDSTGLYIDDVKRITPAAQSAFTSPATLTLFALNNNGSVISFTKYKLHYCKIWDNNTLVRDLIPVLDWDMTPCMYDRVSGQLFYNQGAGSFSYGREIHPVEYLESTGTQYIDTGVILSSTNKVEALAEYTGKPSTGSSYIFGTYGSSKNFGINADLPNSGNFYGVWYNQGTITASTPKPEIDTRYKVEVSSNGIYINDTLFSTVSGTFTGSNPAYLFWANGTGQPKSLMKLYSCQMWHGSNLVRDFIPAIDKNGVPFLFDRVTHTIFDNAGTGAFKYPPVELEYLEGTGTQYIDTGLNYWADFEIGVKLRENVSNVCISNGQYCRLQRNNAENPCWVFTGGQQNVYRSNIPITEYHSIKWKNLIISVDGAEIATLQKQLNTGYTLYMFANQNGLAYPNMIYFCKLWNPTDGTLVRDFIPCYKDGVAGMVDKLTGTAYFNQGTGSFAVGRIVEPKYE